MLFSVFDANEAALYSLVDKNIFYIRHSDASSSLSSSQDQNNNKLAAAKGFREVAPFSPLYLQAFKRLTEDKEISRRMTLLDLQAAISEQSEAVHKVEEELVKLARISESRLDLLASDNNNNRRRRSIKYQQDEEDEEEEEAAGMGVRQRSRELDAKLAVATEELRQLEKKMSQAMSA